MMNNFLRQQYLQAMGVQSWLLRTSTDEIEQEFVPEIKSDTDIEPALQPAVQTIKEADIEVQIVEAQAVESQAVETQAVESQQTELQKAPQKTPETIIEDVPSVVMPVVSAESLPVSELQQSINQCRQCPGRQTRLNALSGQGNLHGSVFVISEPPNADEDRSGTYLSAQAQTLFTAMLQSIHLQDDYFFTGIIKCYSLTDYLFSEQEINHCAAFLQAQIEQLKPSVILVLGAAPSQALLQTKKSFNELRGQAYSIKINDKDYPLVISYHPAYLLRNSLYKREALKDLILLKSLLQ